MIGEQERQQDKRDGEAFREEQQTESGQEEPQDQPREGEQADEKSANLDAKGDEEEKQTPGSQRRDELGRDTGERHVRPEDEARSEAVDQVDQSGQPQESEQQADGEGIKNTRLSGANALMEQWLDQVEGDPAQLMQQQFKLEEYKYLRSRGGRDTETRPW